MTKDVQGTKTLTGLNSGGSMENRDWTIGGSVVVKPGIKDPDRDGDIGGWQGRITDISTDEEVLLKIQWDSITLKKMPSAFIAWCEEEGLSWSEMNLGTEELEPTAARDTEDDVARTIAELEPRYNWLYLGGKQGKLVQEIVNSAQDRDEFTVFHTWHTYLEKHLVVPFAAKVVEYQRGPIRQGARVTVLAITFLDETYGTIVAVKHKDGVHELPLCDLEATQTNPEMQLLVEAYSGWYANR